MVSDTRPQAGILLQELLHLIRVSGKNDYNFITVVFHLLYDGVDCLITVHAVPVINKRIRLVDKENSALCFLEFLLYYRCRPAYEFAYEICTSYFHHVAFGQHIVISHYLREKPSYTCLRRTGVTRKHHVH